VSLATALCVLALLFGGNPARPLAGRLEAACVVVQGAIAADHASWAATVGDSASWAVRWCHRDEWTYGAWECRTLPVLVRDCGGAVECLAEPSVADEAGPLEVLGGLGYAMEHAGSGEARLSLRPVVIVDDARRRVLARELYPLLPGLACE
jgi:hypothetical protein